MDAHQRARIRALNDKLRQHHIGGTIFITDGIDALGSETILRLDEALRRFDDFSPDNDPYGEHDFGALTVDGHKIFFKIDYYDASLCHGSPDPADPDVTRRVMTIMLASEY